MPRLACKSPSLSGSVVALAQEAGVGLRQSYARLAPRLAPRVGRYAHARQFKRIRKALKKLKGYTGRVMRDLRRHLQDMPEGSLQDRIISKLALVSPLLHQRPKGADKIYALHEPEVDCISKGKARVRYEFGCKVSVATTLDEGFVVGMRSFAGKPLRRSYPPPGAGTGDDPDRPPPRSERLSAVPLDRSSYLRPSLASATSQPSWG